MVKINRDPSTLSNKQFDLIIIGGGIYGVMLSLVSTQRGLKPLLLERDDFGGATSYNSLRIIHGGLRYLQKLDFHRLFESVKERKWFLRNFPGLVEPLPCLMPLYNRGLQRKSILRIALFLNDLLSSNRNKSVPDQNKLHSGFILSPKKVKNIFPLVDEKGLEGAAVWFDGSIPDSQRVLIEILKNTVNFGGSALNYAEVKDIIVEEGNVKGVVAYDKVSEQTLKFSSNIVINAAGPWSREISQRFDSDFPDLFQSSIAWNILFNREALSSHAVAVTPHREGATTLFLRPWKGMLLAGTIHESWNKVEKNPMPSESSIEKFIRDINLSIPKLNLTKNDIFHIYSGLLPAKEEGNAKLAVREVILDHSRKNGPKGLYSISGVKFTTARLVAEKVIKSIFTNSSVVQPYNLNYEDQLGIFDFNWYPDENGSWRRDLKRIIEEESVVHLDDLIFRRTSLGDNPGRALEIAPLICSHFNWDKLRTEAEIERVKNYYKSPMKNREINFPIEESIK